MKPDTIYLFGGSGDLATRMLMPALYYLHADQLLDEHIRIIAIARSQMSRDEYIDLVQENLQIKLHHEQFSDAHWQTFAQRLDYYSLDVNNPEAYQQLHGSVKSNTSGRIYYLAVSPSLYGTICQNLSANNLIDQNTRVVLEKPIGHDIRTSFEINQAVGAIFPEEHIFRIDHYLGKEPVQNLIALRFANRLFEPLWNNVGIDHVQITVSEQVGLEGRTSYYNETGALRDMVQNHLLQLLCLVAMEPPREFLPDSVRNEKVKVLRSLRPFRAADVTTNSVRGYYTAGSVDGQVVPGYVDELGADTQPAETFVALRLDVDNWRWAGVPFYIRTGKRLPYKYSEIYIQFKSLPYSIFRNEDPLQPNKLIIRLQPDENIQLIIMNKVPGRVEQDIQLSPVSLNLNLNDAYRRERRHSAYERLLLDILRDNSTLFVGKEEIEASWEWIDGVINAWNKVAQQPRPYPAGTWGPSSAIALPERYGHQWNEQ